MKALEIVNLEMEREERLERIARIKDTVTNVSRIIYIDDELEMEEGQIVDNLGLHWADEEDKYFGTSEGYQGDGLGETAVIFRAEGVAGYKVKYYHEMWGEENEVSYEETEDLIEEYSPVYQLLGTDENAFGECEILVSNDTKFKVVGLEEPNDEEDYYIVDLEVL